MRRIGFSTGALARGDFREGIRLQVGRCDAIELSALREEELDPLVDAISTLSLETFPYVSFHAPSHLQKWNEKQVVTRLMQLPEIIESIIVHPNIITDDRHWVRLGSRLVVENMDQRYSVGKSASELNAVFRRLPQARFCFDVGHARQVDPTMGIAVQFLDRFSDRLAEIHISEVDADSRHCPISFAASQAFQRVLPQIDNRVPVIIESVVTAAEMNEEFEMARRSFCELSPAAMPSKLVHQQLGTQS